MSIIYTDDYQHGYAAGHKDGGEAVDATWERLRLALVGALGADTALCWQGALDEVRRLSGAASTATNPQSTDQGA